MKLLSGIIRKTDGQWRGLCPAVTLLVLFLCTGTLSAFQGVPKITIEYSGQPGPLLYDTTAVGGTSTQKIRIINTGNAILSGSFSFTGSSFSVDDASFAVVMFSSKFIDVDFNPVVGGIITDTLIISSNDPTDPSIRVPLSGTAVYPTIALTDTLIDFGVVSGLASVRLPYKNPGAIDLVINSVTHTDTAGIFTLSSTSETVSFGDSSGIYISFMPLSSVIYYDTLTVVTNTETNAVRRIFVSGEGLPALIVPRVDSLQFGNIHIGEQDTASFYIANEGAGLLNISDLSVHTPEYSVSPASSLVQTGDSVLVSVIFAPLSQSVFSDSVTVLSYDFNNPVKNIYLTGRGVTPAAVLSNTTLDFGLIAVSQAAAVSDTLINTGDETLTVQSVSISDAAFTTTLSAGASVVAGDTLIFTIQFAPLMDGLFSGTLTVTTNDYYNPTSVISLSGTGVGPEILVFPASLAFDTVTTGASDSLDINIISDGGDSLHVSNVTFGTGVFSILNSDTVLAAGDTAVIPVVFTPTARRVYLDTMTILSDAGEFPSIQVPLSGNLLFNDVPAVSAIPDSTIAEGDLYQYTVTAADSDGYAVDFTVLDAPAGMTVTVLNDTTSLISWQTDNSSKGVYTISVRGADNFAAADTQTFVLTVTGVNDLPVITSIPDTEQHVDSLYTYQITYTDPDGDVPSFRLLAYPVYPEKMTVSSSGLISWNPRETGTFPVTVLLNDGNGGTASQSFEIEVTPDRAPVITALPDSVLFEGSPYRGSITAEDWEDAVLTYTLPEAPDGMTIDSASGMLTWTPDNGDAGSHPLRIRVSDSRNNFTDAFLTLTVLNVNSAPVIIGIADTAVFEDDEIVLSFTIFDPDTGTVLTISDNTGLFDVPLSGIAFFTPVNDDVGSYNISIIVSDGYLSDTLDFSLIVENTNDAPVLSHIPDTTAFVGKQTQVNVQAVDIDGDSLSYHLVSSPANSAIDRRTGLLQWVPDENQQGVRAFVVRAADPFGAADTTSFNISVGRLNKPPVTFLYPELTFKEDHALRFDKKRAGFDPDNDITELTWSFEGGDSITVDADDSVAIFTAPQNWYGSEPFAIILSDPAGLSDTLFTIVTVLPVNDPPQLLFVMNAVDTAVSGRDTLLFTYSSADADNDTLFSVWYVNNDSVSSIQEYRFVAADFGSGEFGLRLEVTDGIDTVSNSWRVTVTATVTGVTDNGRTVPDEFRLEPAYPNPFNQSVNIPFAVPQMSNVRITIYDLKGQEIQTILNDPVIPGFHQARWDGCNNAGVPVASGWYFVSMRSAHAALSRPLLLIR